MLLNSQWFNIFLSSLGYQDQTGHQESDACHKAVLTTLALVIIRKNTWLKHSQEGDIFLVWYLLQKYYKYYEYYNSIL